MCAWIRRGLAVEVPVSFVSRFARGGADSAPARWATRVGPSDRLPRHKIVAAAVVHKEGGLVTGGEFTLMAQVAIAHLASPMHEPEGGRILPWHVPRTILKRVQGYAGEVPRYPPQVSQHLEGLDEHAPMNRHLVHKRISERPSPVPLDVINEVGEGGVRRIRASNSEVLQNEGKQGMPP